MSLSDMVYHEREARGEPRTDKELIAAQAEEIERLAENMERTFVAHAEIWATNYRTTQERDRYKAALDMACKQIDLEHIGLRPGYHSCPRERVEWECGAHFGECNANYWACWRNYFLAAKEATRDE